MATLGTHRSPETTCVVMSMDDARPANGFVMRYRSGCAVALT